MPEAPSRHVFVYGTLRRGGRNDINRLRDDLLRYQSEVVEINRRLLQAIA